MFKKGYKMSDEHRKNISKAKKGVPFTEAHKKNIAIGAKGKVMLSVRGELSPRWQGGYERKLWHNNQRRIKQMGNGGSHTLGEWQTLKAQYNFTCPCCKIKEPEIKLTRDHIISLKNGGSDNIENIQPLCMVCNSRKNSKDIKYEK